MSVQNKILVIDPENGQFLRHRWTIVIQLPEPNITLDDYVPTARKSSTSHMNVGEDTFLPKRVAHSIKNKIEVVNMFLLRTIYEYLQAETMI